MMDTGAFMQSFTGEPIMPTGNSKADKVSIKSGRQSSGDLTADHETISFIQAVQQILEQTGTEHDIGNEFSDLSQTAQEPSDGVSRMVLFLEMFGQSDIRELESMTNLENDSNAEDALADLLVQINAQLPGMEITIDDLSGDDTGIETSLMNLLHKKMPALETSIPRSETAASDDTLKDLQKTRSLAQAAMGQDLNPVEEKKAPVITVADVNIPTAQCSDADEMGGANDVSANEKIVAKLPDLMARMANDPPADDSADTIASSSVIASKKKGPLFVVGEDSNRTDIPGEAESDAFVQARADISDGKINRYRSLAQALMPQRENIQARQDSNQSPPQHSNRTDPPHPLEWSGLEKEVGENVSTVTVKNHTAISQQAFNERHLANEKQSLKNVQQPQTVENEPAKASVPDVSKSEVLVNDSLKVAVSANSNIDNRPSIIESGRSDFIPKPASGDSAFQKAVMDQIVEKATLRSVNDRSEMRIQLKPDTLGDVRMSIVSEKNQLVVQMIADKPETKEIIESQIHQLKVDLDKQGLTVGKIEVMISANNDQQDSRGQFFQMFKNGSDGSGKRQNGTRQERASQHEQSDETEADSSGDGINYFV